MLKIINRIFLGLLMLAAVSGIALSITILLLAEVLSIGAEEQMTENMEQHPEFYIIDYAPAVSPETSPHAVNITLRTPPLQNTDLVSLQIYSNGQEVGYADCLETLDYAGLEEFDCPAFLPYKYEPSHSYKIFAVLTRGSQEYVTGPVIVAADWASYEAAFLGFSWFMGALVAFLYLFILLPVLLIVLGIAWKTDHKTASQGEYSWKTLFFPLGFGKTLLQKFHALLLSPYFWAFEGIGILAILLYMGLSSEMWKSYPAFIAFAFSGLMAFVIPVLWCAAWWYADYREREPLRLMVTFFLWGMLAALMAIGLNSLNDVCLGLFGLAFLGAFLFTPLIEEFFKGAGLCLLAEHHEYDSVEDGIVFGFTIGMGFAFIENWIYFLDNPLGSDIVSWILLFLMRSVLFSANHGFYTAITGAVIGYLIEKKFQAPALGLFIGVPIAAFFHAMHNSSEFLVALLGIGGILIYCCFLIPFFDYGGFVLLLLLFIRALIRQKGR